VSDAKCHDHGHMNHSGCRIPRQVAPAMPVKAVINARRHKSMTRHGVFPGPATGPSSLTSETPEHMKNTTRPWCIYQRPIVGRETPLVAPGVRNLRMHEKFRL
jgi:hypothetical protein